MFTTFFLHCPSGCWRRGGFAKVNNLKSSFGFLPIVRYEFITAVHNKLNRCLEILMKLVKGTVFKIYYYCRSGHGGEKVDIESFAIKIWFLQIVVIKKNYLFLGFSH